MTDNKGWKAIWISKIDNYCDLDDYTNDQWNDTGERELSKFAKEYGIEWYDPDCREFDLDNEAKNFKELFSGVSHEKLFLDELMKDLSKYDIDKFKSFMIISDYKYNGNQKGSKSVFVGNYRYG